MNHSRNALVTERRAIFWLGLAGVAGLAFLMRFYRLAELPPGLHYDEAFNGADAYRLTTTSLAQWPLFFSGNFGREPLFNYLLTIAQAIAGPSILTLRFIAALIGALLTPALAWLAWEAAPSLHCNRRRLALWAGLAVLALLWSQIFARYVLRVEFFALLETLFLAALWRGWHTRRMHWYALAGLLGGLAFYTYLPVRLLPAIFVPPGLALLFRRGFRAPERRGLIVAGLVALIVIAPLAGYFMRNPADFAQRLNQVSLLQRPRELWHNVGAVAGMFFVSGDVNPRNNIPGRAALDWLMVAPFLAGLFYLVRRALRPAHLLLLSWFGVMLLPTLLSEYAPSFQRAIGALPPTALFIAVGLDRSAAWLGARRPQARTAITAALSVLLVASLALTWQAFRSWSADPEIFFARDVGFVELAEALNPIDKMTPVYISPRGSDHPTLNYLLSPAGATGGLRGFDGRSCVRISPPPGGRYVFLAQEDARGPELIRSYLPDAVEGTLVQDPFGRPWATQFTQPAPGRVVFPEMQPFPASWEGDLRLLGYWLSMDRLRPGERLYIRLFWQPGATPQANLKVFAHLLDAPPAGTPTVLAGFDSEPGRGVCATTSWLPGEIIVDELEFELPLALPKSAYYLEIGLYDAVTQVRTPLSGNAGDVLLLGPMMPVAP